MLLKMASSLKAATSLSRIFRPLRRITHREQSWRISSSRDPVAQRAGDQREQPLPVGQGRRRFVKQQHLRPVRERPHDLDFLAHPKRQIPDQRRWRNVGDAMLLQDLLCVSFYPACRDEAKPVDGRSRQEQVYGDG